VWYTRASELTITDLKIPESATRIVTTFDICRFQGVTALALTTLWKPWVFAVNIIISGMKCVTQFVPGRGEISFSSKNTTSHTVM
jgi:hypothetical protein